ncbi:MAG TPA: DUF6319 family protein [Pseudonocardiaceae bacterium]|nr:DUF6319 family protein [Pseudonocardiaceae bacterium]
MDTATKSDSLTEQETSPEAAVETAATPKNGAVNGVASTETTGAPASNDESAADEQPKRGRPRKQSTARKTRTIELTLTVTGTAEGEWQAELTHGGKRVVQGLAVSAAAVSRAAKELHPDISGNIDTVITAAREAHQQRMAELEAEMEKVKQALAELED